MDERTARQQVVEAGRRLLEEGLVARTWGNVSCRIDERRYAITPSGIGYQMLREEDIVVVDMESGEWEGIHKPSGEKGVHSAGYRMHPDAGFIVHTHQTYASAYSIAGFENLKISQEESEKLGGVALAAYGLPGMKKLTESVTEAYAEAGTVLMAHHGVVFVGASGEEAFEKAKLLEDICKRNIRSNIHTEPELTASYTEAFMALIHKQYPLARLVQTPHINACANKGSRIVAQVDDMAQMIGRDIPVMDKNSASVLKALQRKKAVMIRGMGIIVCAEDAEDVEALEILVKKAAICKIHASLCGQEGKLSAVDTALMHLVYEMKYSKQKGKER